MNLLADAGRIHSHLYLNSHYFISFLKNHLIDTAEGSATDLAQIAQIVRRKIVNLGAAELQLSGLVGLRESFSAIEVIRQIMRQNNVER